MTPYIPRHYQADAVQRSVAFLRAHPTSGGLVVLPTGAGKSIVIAGIAKAIETPLLVFQPSREILLQNASKLMAYGYDPAVYSASLGRRDVGSITLATIGTAKSNPELFDQFPYVLIDEAHLVNPKEGMYATLLKELGDVGVLGLTATPYRLTVDGYGGGILKFLTRTRPRVFSKVVAYAQVRDLMTQGYLVRPEYKIVSGFSSSQVALNTKGTDFSDLSLRRYYNRIGFHDRLRRVVLRLRKVGRKRILVFTRFIEEAENLRKTNPEVQVVTAKTPKLERAGIIADFRSGEIPCVANVGVMGLGVDIPELDTVVLAQPTLSLVRYYQQVGRSLRVGENGKVPWVVDLVDQVRIFGEVEHLWLQPGGASGDKWEVVSNPPGKPPRVLTNVYFQTRRKEQWRGSARRWS